MADRMIIFKIFLNVYFMKQTRICTNELLGSRLRKRINNKERTEKHV